MSSADILDVLGGKKNLLKLFHSGTSWFDDGPSGASVEETRWDKAVTAINALSQQVIQIDPDGIDVYCFPGGSTSVDKYTNVKDNDSMKMMVSARGPGGPCIMHDALDLAFSDCKQRGGTRPCSVLVITAGEPSDCNAVTSSVTKAISELRGRLTITFVHIGDDPAAESFMKRLDNLDANIDTLKDEEIRHAMDEMQQPDFRKGILIGALCGAVVGMATGAGGAHAYSKRNADRRVRGWNGSWEVMRRSVDPPSGVVITVKDDMAGHLTIEGYPEDGGLGLPSTRGAYKQDESGFYMMREVQVQSKGKGRGKSKNPTESMNPPGSLCVNGCGRPKFGGYNTCCSHCKGSMGPHAKDCRRPSIPDSGPTPAPLCSRGCGRRAFGAYATCCRQCTGQAGPHANDCAAKTLCIKGCGRVPYGQYPTCCRQCNGPEGPHGHDCSMKVKTGQGLMTTTTKQITGTVMDEHLIQWSDGTSWREVAPDGKGWDKTTIAAGAGGALAGAGIGGAIGALIQKSFFKRACDQIPGDYIIVVDRSEKMVAVDKGPGFS